MSKAITNDMKITTIKITSFENKNLQGIISNSYFENDKQFDNLMSLLIIINELTDELGFPQKATEQRSFEKSSKRGSERKYYNLDSLPDVSESEPVLRSFELMIRFRQASSWQGTVKCIETNDETEFDSDLNLLRFILNELNMIAK